MFLIFFKISQIFEIVGFSMIRGNIPHLPQSRNSGLQTHIIISVLLISLLVVDDRPDVSLILFFDINSRKLTSKNRLVMS